MLCLSAYEKHLASSHTLWMSAVYEHLQEAEYVKRTTNKAKHCRRFLKIPTPRTITPADFWPEFLLQPSASFLAPSHARGWLTFAAWSRKTIYLSICFTLYYTILYYIFRSTVKLISHLLRIKPDPLSLLLHWIKPVKLQGQITAQPK